jgi:DNA-binding transcriptional ArsR family regulator
VTLRAELAAIVERLAAEAQAHGAGARHVALDALGEAIGALAVSSEEIDAMITSLEARGLDVTAPRGGDGEARLRIVLATARELQAALGRRPSPAEIAERSGLSPDAVRHALALARVMQR